MPSSKKYSLIILDRDGVINQDSPHFIKSPTEWKPIPGSLEAIAKLNKLGYKVVIATNQSGIARKLLTTKDLQDIHAKMEKELSLVNGYVDDIFICPHLPEDGCDCRKPKAGLLKGVSNTYSTTPDKILSIGDSKRDLDAAITFGCNFYLVLTGNGKKTLSTLSNKKNISIFDNLSKAVEHLIEN